MRRIPASVAVTAFVVAAVAMMIIPVPTPLLDILLAANLALAVTILVAATSAPSALELASFPAWLVLTTLLRLGLNVSSVRAILSRGDAGRVIDAFGSAVIRGDVIVGASLFIMLALVQYFVIARGAERVAEVAARFALDALPGRQLAIDADLRAGTISADVAEARRQALHRESQVFGALDGAMRFVKSDAIAGMIIVAIAFSAGMVLGVVRDGRGAADALKTYARLAIGDGLVTQIPSLLLSLSAGILVTKTSASDRRARQDFSLPALFSRRALFATAIFSVGLALVPGLPAWPFATLAIVLAIPLALGSREEIRVEEARPTPVTIAVSPELGVAFVGLERALSSTANAVAADLGVALPPLVIRLEATLPPRGYAMRLWELPLVEGTVPDGKALVDLDPAALPRGIEAQPARHPLTGSEAAWIPSSRVAEVRALGAATWEGVELLLADCQLFVERAAPELIGLDETRRLLDTLAHEAPALVRDVVPQRLDLPRLAALLRALVAEGISIRPLREILEAVALSDGEKLERLSLPALTERVRRALSRSITHRFAPARHLPVFVLDSMTESMVRDAMRPTDQGARVTLEPALQDELVRSVAAAQRARRPGPTPVLLTSAELRGPVRRILERELPRLRVVAYPELLPDVEVETVARIAVADV